MTFSLSIAVIHYWNYACEVNSPFHFTFLKVAVKLYRNCVCVVLKPEVHLSSLQSVANTHLRNEAYPSAVWDKLQGRFGLLRFQSTSMLPSNVVAQIWEPLWQPRDLELNTQPTNVCQYKIARNAHWKQCLLLLFSAASNACSLPQIPLAPDCPFSYRIPSFVPEILTATFQFLVNSAFLRFGWGGFLLKRQQYITRKLQLHI